MSGYGAIDELSQKLAQGPGPGDLRKWLGEVSQFLNTLKSQGIHCWCKHPHVCISMVSHLYSRHNLMVGRQALERVDATMGWSLSECTECIAKYHAAKKKVSAQTQDCCNFLDCQRLEKAQVSVFWVLEVVRCIEPLTDGAINEKFTRLLKEGASKQLCASDVFPGMYQLLGHHDEEIRQLVWQHHVHELKTEADIDSLNGLLTRWKNLLRGGMQGASPFVPQDRQVYVQQMGPLWKGLLSIMRKSQGGGTLLTLIKKHPEFVTLAFFECTKDPRMGSGEIHSAIQCAEMFLEQFGAETFNISPAYQPPRLLEILVSLVPKLDKLNLQKSVLSSIVRLAKCSMNTIHGDQVFLGAVAFLLAQVGSGSRNFPVTIRGCALKGGYELVELAWGMKKAFTRVGHIYGASLERLLVKSELSDDPCLVNMVHPTGARLASNIVVADACMLASSLSAVQRRTSIPVQSAWTGIPFELAVSALSWQNSSWACIPLIWDKMAWCSTHDGPTLSKISTGFLVAGATLSRIVLPPRAVCSEKEAQQGGGGGFLKDPLDGLCGGSNGGSREQWQPPESLMEACRGQVVIAGDEASLMERMLRAIGWHLDRMAEGSAEQLFPEDRVRGWRGLAFVCTGIHPSLRHLGLRVVKVLAEASGVLESEEVGTGVAEGCKDLLTAAGQQVWGKLLLASLMPILTLLNTVVGSQDASHKKVSGKLQGLINAVWTTGVRAVCCTDDLLAANPSPDNMKEFFSFQESLWHLKVGQEGISQDTLSAMEVWLVELLNLGPRLQGGCVAVWAGFFSKNLGEVAAAMLPESLSVRMVELMTSPELGAAEKFMLQRLLSGGVRKAPTPSISDLLGTRASELLNLGKPRDGGNGSGGSSRGEVGMGSLGGGVGGLGMGPAKAPAANTANLEALWNGFDRAKLVTSRAQQSSRPKRASSPKGADQKKKIRLDDLLRSTPEDDDEPDTWPRFTQGGFKPERATGGLKLGGGQSRGGGGGGGLLGARESDLLGDAAWRGGPVKGEVPNGIKRIELNATDHRMNRKTGNRTKNYAKPLFKIDAMQQEFLSWDVENLNSPDLTWQYVNTIPNVPNKFATVDQYCKVFKGLLLEELRADMQQQWEELKQRQARPVSKLMTVKNVQRISDLHNVTFSYTPDDRLFFRPEDLLLFTSRPADLSDKLPSQWCTGLVKSVGVTFESDGTKNLEVRIHFKGAAPIGSQGGRKDPSSFVRKGWRCHATTLMSLLTHSRELQALSGIPSLPTPLVNQILNPLPPVAVPLSLDRIHQLPPHLRISLEEKYNDSQQKAIASAIAGKGHFSLVQGPPGTGKTSAILGMMSGLLETLYAANRQGRQDSPSSQQEFQLPSRKKKIPQPSARISPSSGPPVRILICAQSNAAIDELIARISVGELMTGTGDSRVPSMVRMGRILVTHSSVVPYHIDSLCDKEMETNQETAEASRATNESKKKLDKTVEALEKAKVELVAAEAKGGGNDNLKNTLKDKIRQMQGAIGRIRAEIRCGRQTMDQAKRGLRLRVIRDAELVFSTLSSAAGDLASLCNSGSVAKQVSFDALIVDEAAQALEPSTLVPLKLLKPAARIILVGDPRQLPPTVFSSAAAGKNFGQSLFERFEKAGYPVEVLSEQYRMHPKISRFPSKHFYRNQLVDGSGITAETRGAPFHSKKCFAPFVFYDCVQGRESRRNRGSIENQMEADLVAMLFAAVKTEFKEEVGNVAIIAPYKAQVDRIKRCLEHQPMLMKMRAGQEQSISDLNVEVATVDSFQGREADIVIISLVRAQDRGSGSANVGFLNDVRRMNVALTRARRALWVVGHGETLQTCQAWNAFIDHAKETGCRTIAQPPFRSLLDASHSPAEPTAPRMSSEKIAEYQAMFEQQIMAAVQPLADRYCPAGSFTPMDGDKLAHVRPSSSVQPPVPSSARTLTSRLVPASAPALATRPVPASAPVLATRPIPASAPALATRPAPESAPASATRPAPSSNQAPAFRLACGPVHASSTPRPALPRKRERDRTTTEMARTDKLAPGPPKRSRRCTAVRSAAQQPLPSEFIPTGESARRANFLKRFGVGGPSDKTDKPNRPLRTTAPARTTSVKKDGVKPRRAPVKEEESGFDITELLGSVVQSNSRPRAFHGHTAGTMDRKRTS